MKYFQVDPEERNYRTQITRIILKRELDVDLGTLLFPRVRRLLSPVALPDDDMLKDMRRTLAHVKRLAPSIGANMVQRLVH